MSVLSLKKILSDLKYHASKNPGTTYRRMLKNGLTVYVKVDEGFMWIGCSRGGKRPGLGEMETVLRDADSPKDVRQQSQWKFGATQGNNPIRFIWASWLMPAELFEVPQVAVRASAYE